MKADIRSKIVFNSLPFFIGPQVSPEPPTGLPESLDLVLVENENGLIRQIETPRLRQTLELAYTIGNQIGTPLSVEGLGQEYLKDFMQFMLSFMNPDEQLVGLEIGCGRGWLTKTLNDSGFPTVAIEPGQGYKHEWGELGIQVIEDFFPSEKLDHKVDFVTSFAVLEHIGDLDGFLHSVKKQLTTSGWMFVAVPDCSEEIMLGDPSILVHEHLSFFTETSLGSLLQRAGFEGRIEKSNYGRCLYAAVKQGTSGVSVDRTNLTLDSQGYPSKAFGNRRRIRDYLRKASSRGSLGIFAGARSMSYMSLDLQPRFFDDDSSWHGHFLPPFSSPIEPRAALLAQEVDTLFIASRTFGATIAESLRGQGYGGTIQTISDLA